MKYITAFIFVLILLTGCSSDRVTFHESEIFPDFPVPKQEDNSETLGSHVFLKYEDMSFLQGIPSDYIKEIEKYGWKENTSLQLGAQHVFEKENRQILMIVQDGYISLKEEIVNEFTIEDVATVLSQGAEPHIQVLSYEVKLNNKTNKQAQDIQPVYNEFITKNVIDYDDEIYSSDGSTIVIKGYVSFDVKNLSSQSISMLEPLLMGISIDTGDNQVYLQNTMASKEVVVLEPIKQQIGMFQAIITPKHESDFWKYSLELYYEGQGDIELTKVQFGSGTSEMKEYVMKNGDVFVMGVGSNQIEREINLSVETRPLQSNGDIVAQTYSTTIQLTEDSTREK
ncbi:hypothetical protein EJF36_17140 [Bacillus sp. HMF5848]|uniref:hypothetical protein n=1 Tax=Bacillus sp. HMF5848 TaxID=2495421 RepID=UPI000F770E69|nr:hypothetical protein [Bacillus sp. HMF5848]RSK28453.1 hypothetical protein EJF36_17140 [Bacillus sp. HMF5848]